MKVREGILLRCVIGGREHWGEAAPLPGYSDESLEQVIHAALQQDWHRFPSLQFAFTSLTPQPTGDEVPVNRLLVGDDEDFPLELRQLRDLPHVAIKLKVARGATPEIDIRRVQLTCTAMRPDQRLRLDANRRWNYEEAERFLVGVAGCPIEYIEEPTGDPMDFERLFASCGVPYALDETLRTQIDVQRFPHASTLIIKPTILGLNDSLTEWIDSGKRLVFSSTFEAGVGLWHVARLASEYALGEPAGLDTYRWLGGDVIKPRFDADAATFNLRQTWHIDPAGLEELTP